MKRLFGAAFIAAGIVWLGQWLLGVLDEMTDNLWDYDLEEDGEPDGWSTLEQWREWWGYEDDD